MKSEPVAEWDKKEAEYLQDRLLIGGHQVMMSWEKPYMHKLAQMLCSHTSGNILEIGFGMAISASEIQRSGVRSHTIIEPHPEVFKRALAWKNEYSDSEIILFNDYWQNITDKLQQYDGIFFDTYSDTDEETDRKRFHFFQMASEKLLKPGGALTFYYLKPQLEPTYQDQLFRYFSKIYIERLDITPPHDCDYAYFIENHTVCVLAVK
ncbi:class I SAM-dependent methyltransferase [Desulfonema magnum]|uniref:SAM-dependent methyltransferase domain-containing protein n=1 Tax=Desulfonema magnum TaxID=45655 RepID=A0A975GS35_9BACT|nr:class I SAM-dependent methyltransferase [Desulfonema magnum]QTA91619.1 SAM-dependent methyltransferase domain-containing protein [Desulfonema magnum]